MLFYGNCEMFKVCRGEKNSLDSLEEHERLRKSEFLTQWPFALQVVIPVLFNNRGFSFEI